MSHRPPSPKKGNTKKRGALVSLQAGNNPIEGPIHIDIGTRNKNYSSLLSIAKRKLNLPSTRMPSDLKPMLASIADEPFDSNDWQFEIKLDGYRTLAFCHSGTVELKSRNNKSFNSKFEPVHTSLLAWPVNAVLDGEIVVLNEKGVPDFEGIQQWESSKEGQLFYYVFDLLWLDGLDITSQPLHLRRALLKSLLPEEGIIRYSDHIDMAGVEFFELAKQNNLEGIIAKKKDSPYISGGRTKNWIKIKVEEKNEAIICGYTRKPHSDRLFSSLILGSLIKGQLQYIGQVGTGFTIKQQEALLKRMNSIKVPECPFEKKPPLRDKAVWVQPHYICEVKYTEITSEGVMRHPSFQGIREDKTIHEYNTESKNKVSAPAKKARKKNTSILKEIQTIDGYPLQLSNLQKFYWSKEKITKGDLLYYYYQIADYIMPYMKDRPQSLNRFPDGINGENFYHKNMKGKVEPWIKTFQRFSDSTGEPKDFLICTNTASLVYMANLGCIEMNPWHSRIQSPLYPDWCVIDLDPGQISFTKVIETALVVKNILESLQIPSYPKTSGSTGIHIYIPLGAKYNYEQSKQLAELIAHLVHEELPDFTSLVRSPAQRTHKIYIDYLQNRPIQTICAPYSVRPKPGATISTPLHWDEVKKGLKISNFTIKNILERIQSEGDLFKGVLGKGIELNKVLKELSSLI
jgi:bifunctional non-homologous end joining protein LigD